MFVVSVAVFTSSSAMFIRSDCVGRWTEAIQSLPAYTFLGTPSVPIATSVAEGETLEAVPRCHLRVHNVYSDSAPP